MDLSLDLKEQRRYVDVIKGLLAFLVVWGHVIQVFSTSSPISFWSNPIYMFICSFHMPLFMLISGYLFLYSFSKRNMIELIIHRCKPMILTIVVFDIIRYYFIDCVRFVLKGDFKALFNGKCLSTIGTDHWFLWAMIACALIASVVFKKVKNKALQLICLFFSVFLILFFPMCERIIFVFPYFIIGFYFALYKDKIPPLVMKLKYLSLVVFPAMLPFYDERHYIYENGLYNAEYSFTENIAVDAFRWAIGLAGCVFTLTVIFLLFKVKPMQKLFDLFAKMGKYTLQIYVYQSFVFFGLSSVVLVGAFKVLGIENPLPENALIYNFVIVPVLTVISTIFFYFMSKWLNKFKFIQTIFGR